MERHPKVSVHSRNYHEYQWTGYLMSASGKSTVKRGSYYEHADKQFRDLLVCYILLALLELTVSVSWYDTDLFVICDSAKLT
jgi:hypothetical protein